MNKGGTVDRFVHPLNFKALFMLGVIVTEKSGKLLRLKKRDENSLVERFGIKEDVINAIKSYGVNYYLIPINTIVNDDYDNVIEC